MQGGVRDLQGYLAHKKHPPPLDPEVALCLGTYGDPRGVGVSYERGTPVKHRVSGRVHALVEELSERDPSMKAYVEWSAS